MTWQLVVLILGILAFFAIAMAINAWQTVRMEPIPTMTELIGGRPDGGK